MAAKPSALPPPPQFGRLERASVSLSTADHSSGSNRQLPTSGSSYSNPPPPDGSSVAKETLLQVQRESSNGVTLRKPKTNQRDKTLRQKGILLSSHSGPRSLSPPPPPSVHPPLNTECYHPLPPPPLLPSPTRSSLPSTDPTASSKLSNQSSTLTSRSTGDDGVLNVFQVMQLSAAASLPEAVGSPDSGYDDLATAVLVCNRSDSIGSTSSSSSSSRRTGPNSGVPSSLFSVRDSELELVKEEDGSDEGEDEEGTERKERGTSNTSSEQSDPPSFPRLSLDESNNFYAPDDETLIQTVQRPGIKRSNSTDMKRMASTMRPSGRAESYSANASNRVIVNKAAGAERGRSQSLFTKGNVYIVHINNDK